MDKKLLTQAFTAVRDVMTEEADYLVKLDGRFGDGDLGISMNQGFSHVVTFLEGSEETDLGRLLRGCSAAFNEAAPSTLGTILSFGLLGMAKALLGKTEATLGEAALALEAGVLYLMDKAKSKVGEKTIVDAIYPAVQAVKENSGGSPSTAFLAAYKAAEQGVEGTKALQGRHGRIAYYGDKTIGFEDAGAVAGMLIFKGLSDFFASQPE